MTGGGTGLGAEICRQLAVAGARVAVNYSRSASEAETVAASLPTTAIAVRADVRDDASVRAMVREAEQASTAPSSCS